ncbi:hypothetical protein [Nocardiopsis lucentensis]|nr:hypothetical protein [Nocardiopsis lucentensis]
MREQEWIVARDLARIALLHEEVERMRIEARRTWCSPPDGSGSSSPG